MSLIDPTELQALLQRQGPALELFASQWTDSAEDCVQDAFLQLVTQARRPDNVVAWLFRVVRNRTISLQRSSLRRQQREQATARCAVQFEPAGDAVWDSETLHTALADLPPEQREIVVARIWGGLSFAQIAELVGGSTSRTHRRYQHGLKQLRKKLESPCHRHPSPI